MLQKTTLKFLVTILKPDDSASHLVFHSLVKGLNMQTRIGLHSSGPSPSAPNITMVNTQSTSITLTWIQPEEEVVDSYEVSFPYQGPCSGFNHYNTTTVDGTTRQYTLTGLQEFSNYTVTVVAVNGSRMSEGEQRECCNHGRWYVCRFHKVLIIYQYFLVGETIMEKVTMMTNTQ